MVYFPLFHNGETVNPANLNCIEGLLPAEIGNGEKNFNPVKTNKICFSKGNVNIVVERGLSHKITG
jgi:hypothetical protein